jgi:mRNA interferase RelE/StbE
MTYKLEFLPSALKEWEKLGHTVREQIKKKTTGAFGSALGTG